MGLQGIEPWSTDYESDALASELQAFTPKFSISAELWCEGLPAFGVGLRLHTYKRYWLNYSILFSQCQES
ncbi:MAG: hypothetical protein G01um10143_651 [Parcubacteria group bacterium Gr01-1014_3]|nr:MAG: hypothetical protein G01um10143_651 [Parcubacteria group bacterium Gr01-1014_3]